MCFGGDPRLEQRQAIEAYTKGKRNQAEAMTNFGRPLIPGAFAFQDAKGVSGSDLLNSTVNRSTPLAGFGVALPKVGTSVKAPTATPKATDTNPAGIKPLKIG